MLEVGNKIPAFSLHNQHGKVVTNSDFSGFWVVLYFYPRDNTPGCTQEACDFRDSLPALQKKGVKVFGVSKDSTKSHLGFAQQFNLPFDLLSDHEGKLCEEFGVWVEKNLYGKTSYGIQRSTFLINSEGVIAHVWPKVVVKGHVNDLKTKLIELKK